jgi:hypothetical protein
MKLRRMPNFSSVPLWNEGDNETLTGDVRFQDLTAASMKMIAFWDIAPCSLEVGRRFKGAYCLHHRDGLDDGGSTQLSETSVYFKETTRRNIQKGSSSK